MFCTGVHRSSNDSAEFPEAWMIHDIPWMIPPHPVSIRATPIIGRRHRDMYRQKWNERPGLRRKKRSYVFCAMFRAYLFGTCNPPPPYLSHPCFWTVFRRINSHLFFRSLALEGGGGGEFSPGGVLSFFVRSVLCPLDVVWPKITVRRQSGAIPWCYEKPTAVPTGWSMGIKCYKASLQLTSWPIYLILNSPGSRKL